jgi:hypothetical protein
LLQFPCNAETTTSAVVAAATVCSSLYMRFLFLFLWVEISI